MVHKLVFNHSLPLAEQLTLRKVIYEMREMHKEMKEDGSKPQHSFTVSNYIDGYIDDIIINV